MKITLTPTKKQTKKSIECYYPTVSVEVPSDNMTYSEILEFLVLPALKSQGYKVKYSNNQFYT